MASIILLSIFVVLPAHMERLGKKDPSIFCKENNHLGLSYTMNIRTAK